LNFEDVLLNNTFNKVGILMTWEKIEITRIT